MWLADCRAALAQAARIWAMAANPSPVGQHLLCGKRNKFGHGGQLSRTGFSEKQNFDGRHTCGACGKDNFAQGRQSGKKKGTEPSRLNY